MGVLGPDKIRALAGAAVEAGLPASRGVLLGALADPEFVFAIADTANPKAQQLNDLVALNEAPLSPAATGPFVTWLETALFLLGNVAQRAVFEGALELLRQGATQPAGDASRSPLEALIVHVSVPVMDRAALRTNLRLLVEEQLPSTLLVTGPPDSGRSTTADFVQWYAGRLDQPVCRVPDATTYDPFELVALQLEPVLALPGSVHRTASLAKPYKHRELAALVRNWILERQTACWIVLDDLDPLKEQPTHPLVDFMNALVQMLSSGTPSRFARMVLLGWPLPEDPKGVPAGSVRREALSYDQVGRSEVEDFVRWLYRERLANTALLDTVLQEAVDRIVPTDAVAGEARLLWIGRRASDEVEALLAGGG